MKILIDDITSFTVSGEDGGYPKENMRDDYPANIYKAVAGVQTATMSLTMPKNCDSIYIGNTNASEGTITVDGTDYAMDFKYDSWESFLTEKTPYIYPHSWIDYELQDEIHTVSVSLTTIETTLEVGLLRCGLSKKFYNPSYGISEGIKDLSIRQELVDGNVYVVDRNKLRTFGARFFAETDGQYDLFRDFCLNEKNNLLAFNLYDDMKRGLVFGLQESDPGYSLDNYNASTFNFNLREVK